MSNKIEIGYVRDDVFPRDVREVVNDLSEAWNRVFEVQWADGEIAPRIEQSDDKWVLILPSYLKSSAQQCELGLFNATAANVLKIGVRWGKINGRQPASMAADGTFVTAVSGTGYVYAFCTFNMTTLQPSAADFLISTNPALPNTTNTGYAMLGRFSETTDGKSLSILTSCGSVTIDPCSLVTL